MSPTEGFKVSSIPIIKKSVIVIGKKKRNYFSSEVDFLENFEETAIELYYFFAEELVITGGVTANFAVSYRVFL